MPTGSDGLRGVFAAVTTPLDEQLQPDLVLFVDHCRGLLANGCDGLAPLGTTGEANSLSLDQRFALLDALGASDLPIEKMIIGAGSCALDDAVRLSALSGKAGAGGVLLLPPFYYKNPSQDGLLRFYSEVIERVGDPNLSIFLYHYPAMTAVPITFELVGLLRARYGGVIRGLKDSSGNWDYSARLLAAFPDLLVFSGSEKFLLKNLRAGGPGCISATTNVTCRLARQLFLCWTSAEADAVQERLNAIRGVFEQFPLQAAVKQALAYVAGAPSWAAVLPPNQPLSEEQTSRLIEALHGLGLGSRGSA